MMKTTTVTWSTPQMAGAAYIHGRVPKEFHMKLTDYQLYCILLILVTPVAYLELPKTLVHILFANSWLAVIAAAIPGLLLIQMYYYIVARSELPFPLMLEEHLGKVAGKLLGLLYIPLFILACSYTLRLFIEFMKMNVLPATPISVLIGVLLLVCWVAIKVGLDATARVFEIVIIIGLTFGLIIVLLALANNFHPERILPIGYLNYRSLGQGTLLVASVVGKLMPVLALAFFIDDKKRSLGIMRWVVFVFIPVITLNTMAIIITRGIMPSLSQAFPFFSMVRLARIGAFIQNLDILFIGIWILGIFGAVTIHWFMACYTTQQVFGLSNYRFVAAPTAMTIGILSIVISRNNLELVIWSQRIIPYVYSFFFILIPLLVFLVTLFKPTPANKSADSGDLANSSSA